MACLRGSAGAGAGSLRQAKTSFAKTGHSYEKRLVSEQEGGEGKLRNEPVGPAQTMGTGSLHKG